MGGLVGPVALLAFAEGELAFEDAEELRVVECSVAVDVEDGEHDVQAELRNVALVAGEVGVAGLDLVANGAEVCATESLLRGEANVDEVEMVAQTVERQELPERHAPRHPR